MSETCFTNPNTTYETLNLAIKIDRLWMWRGKEYPRRVKKSQKSQPSSAELRELQWQDEDIDATLPTFKLRRQGQKHSYRGTQPFEYIKKQM